MLTQVFLQGNWTFCVIGKEAKWDQRVVITGSDDTDGTYGYPGVLESQSISINGKGLQLWRFAVDHNPGSGWSFNELRTKPPTASGKKITYVIESRDTPGSGNPFDDLVLQGEAAEVELIEVPFRPYAVRTDTLQMTPEGIFEATLGTCYMAVRIRNKWSEPLPATSRVRISAQGRKTLQAGGIQVDDNWSQDEQGRVGQQVSGEWVNLGALEPGQMRTIYFKVNCAAAEPRKHTVEFELEQPYKPDATSLKFLAEHKIFASRSGYNPVTGEFYSECDQGTLFLRLRKMAVEYTTLRDAVRCARAYRAKHGPSRQDRVRQILQDLLAGKPVDLCELKRLLDGACDEDGDGRRWPCNDILMIPTEFDYRVEPNPAYAGQFGPLPFDDPFWKALLAILAWILSLAAAASAITDLAYQSDRTVIGSLFDSRLDPEADGYYLVDTALCELNGNRPLPPVSPPIQVLDAQSDEDYTTPVQQLDGVISLTGDYLASDKIEEYAKAYDTAVANPNTPNATDAVKHALVYKSGARTGLTYGLLRRVLGTDAQGKPEGYDRNDKDGVLRVFKHQVIIETIPAGAPLPPGLPQSAVGQAIGRAGDSGSLWIHWETGKIVALNHGGPTDDSGTHAAATRIEDVMSKLNIRFVK